MFRYTASEPETRSIGEKIVTVVSEIPQRSSAEQEVAILLAAGKLRQILKHYEGREGEPLTSAAQAFPD